MYYRSQRSNSQRGSGGSQYSPLKNRKFSSGRVSRFGSSRKQKTVDISLLVKKAAQVSLAAPYQPRHTFDDFLINTELKINIANHGYISPTPIQDQAIPELLLGKDVIGVANTGTGKTAAFIIPLINKVLYNRFEKALIIVPTRELAVQIRDEFVAFSKNMNIFSILCIGGVGIHQQIQGLRRNPDFVIGTPGRLKDLQKQGKLNFASYHSIVLDEVDRMLDMGFIRDIEFIVSQLPQKRQSLFFSATIPSATGTIIGRFLRNPVRISVKTQETPLNVDQDVIRTRGREKIDVLHELLAKEEFDKVIVFGRTKWGIEKLSSQLMKKGVQNVALHGNKNQNQRQRALSLFKRNEVGILLATDIASRGLDIDDVTHVINYDLPETYEDYVHRIGRTGRSNKKGTALSFID